MPEIPEYTSKLGLPVLSQPRIPANAGGIVGAAMEKSGDQMAALGTKLLDQQMDLKRKADLADLSVNASMDLDKLKRDTVNSPEFFTDPVNTANAFAEKTKTLQQDYLSKIQDPQVAAAFKAHFGRESVAHLSTVSDHAMKQQNLMSEGKLWGAVTSLGKLADNAPDDEAAKVQMGQAVAWIDTMVQSGVMKPEEGVKQKEKFLNDRAEHRVRTLALTNPQAALDLLSSPDKAGMAGFLRPDRAAELGKLAQTTLEHKANVARQDQARQDKIEMDAQNLSAYQQLYKDFGLADPATGNYPGAVQAISNPDTAATYGLKSKDVPSQIREVSGMLETGWNRNRAARDDALKQQNEKANGQLLDLYNKKQLTPDAIANSGLPEEKQAHWRAAVKTQAEDMDKTNPTVFNEAYTRILTNPEISVSELPLPGQGVSGKDVKFLLEERQRIQQEPTKSSYYRMAGDEFDRQFKNDPDVKAKKEEFLARLAQDVRASKGKLEGDAIYRRGQELMKEQSRSFVDSWVQGINPFSDQPFRNPRMFEPVPGTAAPPAITPPVVTPPENQPLSPGAKKGTIPQPDQAILDRVGKLRATMSEQQIADALKAKGVDPLIYGLPDGK